MLNCPHCHSDPGEKQDTFSCGNHKDDRWRSDECYRREIATLRERLDQMSKVWAIHEKLLDGAIADSESAETALALLMQHYDEETGTIDVRPNPSCPICTQGVTPNALNKGPCALHRALALVGQGAPDEETDYITDSEGDTHHIKRDCSPV